MTNYQRRIYARIYSKLLDRMEQRFVGKIYKALKTQLSSFTSDVKRRGLDYAKNQLRFQRMNQQIGPVVLDLYIQAGLMNARKVRSELRRQELKFMGRNEQLTREIQRYFQEHLFDKVVLPISETTRNLILAKIQKGVQEGWSVGRILEEVNNGELTRMRARRIVRTETVRASNLGGLLAADNEPFEMQKEWIAVNDRRTRHSHMATDGQIREIPEKFSNGLFFPGDPNGSADDTINCRCTLGYVPKRDRNGRMIPKEKTVEEQVTGRSLLIDILLGIGLAQVIGEAVEVFND